MLFRNIDCFGWVWVRLSTDVRELKYQTFSRGQRQPEVKFTCGPRFPSTWAVVISSGIRFLHPCEQRHQGDSLRASSLLGDVVKSHAHARAATERRSTSEGREKERRACNDLWSFFQPGNRKAWKLSPETRNLSASVTLIPWEQIITLSNKNNTFSSVSSAPNCSLRSPKCRRACSQAVKARLGSQMKIHWFFVCATGV